MSRTSQNGSVISFVVVGVLLTTAVLGGLYVVSERNFFGLGDESSEVAQAGEEAAEDVAGTAEESAGDVVVDTDEPAQAGDEGAPGDEGSAEAPEAPVADETADTPTDNAGSDEAVASDDTATEQTSDNEAVATDGSTDGTEEMATTGFTGETARQTGAAELPTTGPSDSVLAVLGMSSLVAAVLMYRRSTQL